MRRDQDDEPVAPLPRHRVVVTFRAIAPIDPPVLRFECSGQVYVARLSYRKRVGGITMAVDPTKRHHESVEFKIGSEPVPAETHFVATLHSPSPVRLRKIDAGSMGDG